MNIKTIRLRSEVARTIREFFDRRSYLEVETPILAPHLIPESSIEPFSTNLTFADGRQSGVYLVPSPEIWMKRLISEHPVDMYQISRCFRNGETDGDGHNPEFTMIEWYTMGAEYLHSLAITEQLIDAVVPADAPADLKPPFVRITIEEAFQSYAGFSLESALSLDALTERAHEVDVELSGDDTWEQTFNKIFLQIVEPELPTGAPVALLNYPQAVPTLAAEVNGSPWSQRWELYVRGVELANCYTEEINPERVGEYFAHESNIAEISQRTDFTYPQIFGGDYPSCSGVALGIDRLIALIEGRKDIRGVILFPVSDTVWIP